MAGIYRAVFLFSKMIHKYVGLICLVYFLLMGVSGVLLNHPSLVRWLSVPMAWVPESYVYSNWNRMAFREAVYSEKEPDTLYVGGKTGVWESTDGGSSFTPLAKGFPSAAYDMDARCLLLTESDGLSYLYAGTRIGLYRYDFYRPGWQPVDDGTLGKVEIVDLVRTDNQILVFTPFTCYRLRLLEGNPVLRQMPLKSKIAPASRAALFRFLLKLHDGSVLGFPGKLFVDIVGLALIFLSVSAIYIWYIPWRRKRFKKRRRKPRFFRFFHKYHLKFGIYGAFFLGVIALTGIFVRPPLLIAIIRYTVPAVWMNDSRPAGEWPTEISRAVYSPEDDTLLLATRDGFFHGPADFSRAFTPKKVDVPVHGMGVSVLETLSGHRLLIGSFSGMYIWDNSSGLATDIRGNPVSRRGGGRPDATDMASGAAVQHGELRYWVDYRNGITSAHGDASPMVMPDRIVDTSRMSLWHFLFEVHNGRIFRDWLGAYTWLIVPIGGLILLLNVLSGTYDWVYRRFLARLQTASFSRKSFPMIKSDRVKSKVTVPLKRPGYSEKN
jgi:hypothetical protein